MEFRHSDRSLEYQQKVQAFLDERVYPAEHVMEEQAAANRAAGTPHRTPAVVQELKADARSRGLWNLFLPDEEHGAGLSVLDYAPIAELSGRSPALAPEAMNCAAPDTGNMELLHMFGTPEQKERWLQPLLEGEIRSCFSMTEPDVASSDATNIAATAEVVGDEIVINGRKWWSTGVGNPDCKVLVFMGLSDPDADRHSRHTMVLVPRDAEGVTVERMLTTMGYYDEPLGHGEVSFDDVRVPASNILLGPGRAFEIAQGRLGPGRVHH